MVVEVEHGLLAQIGTFTHLGELRVLRRSNNQNRDATPGQKAMATAMAFPDVQKGGDRKTDVFKSLQNDLKQSERNALSRARYVLRNNPMCFIDSIFS